MKNNNAKNYSFALRVKMAREKQNRKAFKNVIGGVAFLALVGAMIYFLPDSIHGSLAFQDAMVNSYR